MFSKKKKNEILYSFEEFKLYYDSAEKVTDRRIAFNKWNYSISVGILVGIILAFQWSIKNPGFEFLFSAITFLLSFVAILFTSLWAQQIRVYKSLNDAKFQVLNKMAEKLEFSTDDPNTKVVSYLPFSKEWEILQEKEAIREVLSMKIIALKSSNMELFIPMAFRGIFAILLIISAISIFGQSVDFLEGWEKLMFG